MKTLKDIEIELIEVQEKTKEENERHEKSKSQLTDAYDNLIRQKEILLNSYDLNKVLNAEKFIGTTGFLKKYGIGSTVGCLEDAIKDVATGFNHLKTMYFGCKDYASWECQRCDCDYGYGPTHGGISFSISLKDRHAQISDTDVEDILYYLNNLKNENFRKVIFSK